LTGSLPIGSDQQAQPTHLCLPDCAARRSRAQRPRVPEPELQRQAQPNERGGQHAQPYTQAIEFHGCRVELPRHNFPATLEARLARFDLSLSAIGVEHTPCDERDALIHPKALESVATGSF
jgi:hypothetical protein